MTTETQAFEQAVRAMPTKQAAKQFLTERANEFLHQRASTVSRKVRREAARKMAKRFLKTMFSGATA